jgi:uridine kinase
MILRLPFDPFGRPSNPALHRKKLFHVFEEYGQWLHIQGIQKLADLNRIIRENRIDELIKVAEGLHEKRIARIADTIHRKNRRIILIAGPSSSGKTTFTKRLYIQLRVSGLFPRTLSLDDYFLDWENTPKDPEGNYDFESPAALDIQRLKQDIPRLLNGKRVRVPRYDFLKGKSVEGPEIRLESGQPLLIEGLHGLNHGLFSFLPARLVHRIYVSVLTQLNITDHLRVSTSDIRFLRRILRGHLFRGHPARHTIERWPLVRQGEENNIFPFQEAADTIFNTSLTYELAVLNPLVTPLLKKVRSSDKVRVEALRLMDLLMLANPVPAQHIPSNSILREFIGDSSFRYT